MVFVGSKSRGVSSLEETTSDSSASASGVVAGGQTTQEQQLNVTIEKQLSDPVFSKVGRDRFLIGYIQLQL